MVCDYKIVNGIYLSQSNYELDLHNDFNFLKLIYSVTSRKLELHWVRSSGDWVDPKTPQAIKIEYVDVVEFRFLPQNSAEPFSEDDCTNMIGYWIEEEWADGVVQIDTGDLIEPEWPTAIEYMSGAVLVVQAKNSSATISG